jgi:hypothetical protein
VLTHGNTKLLGLDEIKTHLQRVVALTTDNAEGVLGGAGLGAIGQQAGEQSRIASRCNEGAVDSVALNLLNVEGDFGIGEGELLSVHQVQREVAVLGTSERPEHCHQLQLLAKLDNVKVGSMVSEMQDTRWVSDLLGPLTMSKNLLL